jgi:hypothetical protein
VARDWKGKKDRGTDIFFTKNECIRVREYIIKRKIGGEYFIKRKNGDVLILIVNLS